MRRLTIAVLLFLALVTPVAADVTFMGSPCADCLRVTGGAMTGPLRLPAGSTTTPTYKPTLTLQTFVSATGVGNGADLTDDPLWTLTPIPANTLATNGDAIVITTQAHTTANANNKVFGVTIGGTQVNSNPVSSNNARLSGSIVIVRVDATHVHVTLLYIGYSTMVGESFNVAVANLATNTLAIVVTGASPVTGAANDVKLYSGVAEWKGL